MHCGALGQEDRNGPGDHFLFGTEPDEELRVENVQGNLKAPSEDFYKAVVRLYCTQFKIL